jgi:hypothetical protein
MEVLVVHEYVWGKIEVSDLKTCYLNDMSNSDVYEKYYYKLFYALESMDILFIA